MASYLNSITVRNLAFLAIGLMLTVCQTAAAQPDPGHDTLEALKAAVLAPPSPEGQFERYEKMQQLLRLAANDETARRAVASDVFSPHVAPDVREVVLAMCERLVRNPDFADLFLPEYVPGLLLIREARAAAGLSPRPDSVLKGYPPARIAAALDGLIQPLPADSAASQVSVQRAAIRAMSDSTLWRLPFQLERFVPSLIGALTAFNTRAEQSDDDTERLIVRALQSITEMRSGLEQPGSGARWQQWFNENLKDKTELERVLVVHANLRANRNSIAAELQGLRLAEELRAVDTAKDNYEALIGFVDPGRDPAVLTRALRYLAARLPGTPLPEAQRDRLLPQLRTVYTLLGENDSVMAELTDTALLIQPQGEELVRTQVSALRKPEVRAAVLLKLARGGRDVASLGVLLRVLGDWRDPAMRVDSRVVKAALSGVAEWKQHDDATAAQVVEALVHLIMGLREAPDGHALAVDVHNAVNALAPRIDTTPVVREVLKPANRDVFSLKLQLVTVRVALSGMARPALSDFLRKYERKEHLLRDLLVTDNPDGTRFELTTTLDILAALGDPFLTPEPDARLYQAAVALYRNPGAANGELKKRVAGCITAFATAEAAAWPIGAGAPTPPFRVFELLMEFDAAAMAVQEQMVDKLPEVVRSTWPDAIRLLRARLGLRTPQFDGAIVGYGSLMQEKNAVPPATQLADLQWALTPREPAERAVRLAVLQRLVTALHPSGAENVPAHIWKALAAHVRAAVAPDAPQPAAALGALRVAHALAAWEPLRPVLLLEANQNLSDWRAAVAEVRQRLATWQTARWRELSAGIEPGKPLPEAVRDFATDKSVGIPAVPEARFQEVPGNDAIAIPDLAQRLTTLAHGDPVTRQLWQLIIAAAAVHGKDVGNKWPPAADYETVRAALLNELRSVHGYR